MSESRLPCGLSGVAANDVHAAVAMLGATVKHAELLGGHSPRPALRLVTDDARVLKARCFADSAAAMDMQQWRAGLDASFPPVLARSGTVLISLWVTAGPLQEPPTIAEVEQAARLMARLHAQPVAANEDPIATATWRREAQEQVRALQAAGQLAHAEADGLRSRLEVVIPAHVPSCLIHRDFRAENLLIDSTGRVVSVDNEWFAIGPAGYDLGYTKERWPMDASAWSAFQEAYRSLGPRDAGPLSFWRIVVQLERGYRLLRSGRPEAATALDRVRELAQGATSR